MAGVCTQGDCHALEVDMPLAPKMRGVEGIFSRIWQTRYEPESLDMVSDRYLEHCVPKLLKYADQGWEGWLYLKNKRKDTSIFMNLWSEPAAFETSKDEMWDCYGDHISDLTSIKTQPVGTKT